jgi:3'-phosphoadenosine 5'-phosphosulfate sulfotransferase (PAPS reductase)/FAD synthetase
MWSMMIARGMRPPSRDMRWCTTRLKINVQKDILKMAFGTENIETVSIVGSRSEESADRAQRLKKQSLEGHLKGHSIYDKTLVYAPIEDFSTEDVWRELRRSKIGMNILEADELWELYASTQGEGEECQTILGNSNENGENPGCSKSGGRFGCWNCNLLGQGGDKALAGMKHTYPYIRHLIVFRDWVTSIRDGNWHLYRDYYNHGDGRRNQYSYDNHRFGMTCPGGLNLATRKEMLNKLLETEALVKKESPNLELISDEELNFIQKRWIDEGDFELTAKRIANKYKRDIHVKESDLEKIKLAKAFLYLESIWSAKVIYWFNIYPDERFCIKFVDQMISTHSKKALFDVLEEICNENKLSVADALMTLQLRKQFFPNESMIKLIYEEWKEDKVSIVTKRLLEDESIHHEIHDEYDDIYNSDISLEEKYAILDNWNWYQNEDTHERKSHPEYSRYKGNTNYIKFRGCIEKNSERVKKDKPKNLFDFAA